MYLFDELPTPCYVIDERRLRENLELLHRVEMEGGCKILLAQKAFSAYHFYPMIGNYISGTAGSGLYEARLGHEEMGKENHVYAPAYKEADFAELAQICDHIVFNSFAQLLKYKDRCPKGGIGIRINPECSTQGDVAGGIYDPCAPGSRLGVTRAQFRDDLLDEIDGLHFHTLCEQNSDALETTLAAVEEKFHDELHHVKWLNMGGGHHITRPDYDVERLIRLVRHMRETYDLEIYLEPGEAIALDAGYLTTEVLDIVTNGDVQTLILDASAACHMPDVLEMPYLPPLRDSFPAGEAPYTYRLSSYTCLAGDRIGDYSFAHPVQVGDRLVFEDMVLYTMVKNNTFNGIPLPAIATMHEDGQQCEILKTFTYEDFKCRL